MEGLTKTINTIKENIDMQTALDKLAAYENAEEQGRIVIIPTEAYYLVNNHIFRGFVQEVKWNSSSNGAFEALYKIACEDSIERTGIFGIDVFNTLKDASEKLAKLDTDPLTI